MKKSSYFGLFCKKWYDNNKYFWNKFWDRVLNPNYNYEKFRCFNLRGGDVLKVIS